MTFFDETVVLSPRRHRYGWRAPLPGRHAPQLLPVADTTGLLARPEVDPRSKMPVVFDQGELGSCTANATAACFQYDSIMDDAIMGGHDCGRLSRLWIYYFERAIEHTLSQGDVGAYGHDAFTVAQHGIPNETQWPYVPSRFNDKPGPCFPRAYRLERPVHSPAQNEQAVKSVLSNDQTVAIGFTVYESFESQAVFDTGVMPMPRAGEEVLGGHEVLVVGYLESKPDHALVRNSWGPEWGDGGYFFMPWAFLLDPTYASDFRTIVR